MTDAQKATRNRQKPPAGIAGRIYTVPAGSAFLDHLAHAILAGVLAPRGAGPPGPLDLSGYTLLLPTRRATRALQEAFLRASGGQAMLLPRILPIAEGQEDLTILTDALEPNAFAESAAGIPPAIPGLDRRLTLTTLVMRWAEAMQTSSDPDAGHLGPDATSPAGATPAQAAQLAAELSRLMDMVETENVSFAGLSALVPEEHSEHWQRTLKFLEIVTASWPAILEERGVTSPADRRNRLILAEARRLAAQPPNSPVIVAGVTGSVPATAELMRAVMEIENGAIVLPCLDTGLDEESWRVIAPNADEGHIGHPEHPQFGLRRLLDRLGIARENVAVLPGSELDTRSAARAHLISEAMRPASTTGRWADLVARADMDRTRLALQGMTLLEAPTSQDEAEAIAYILREAAETPGRTAALVSPDRLLARRVAIRLEAWGIRVDDSAGRPFRKTVPGAFLDLVIEAAAKRFAPAEVMALLKHPLTRLGLDAFAVRRAGRVLEIAAFRGPYLGDGLAGIDASLERASRNSKPESEERTHMAVRRLFDADWDGARDLVRRLATACAPLEQMFRAARKMTLAEVAKAHVAAAESIAALPEAEAKANKAADGTAMPSPIWTGEAGSLAQRFFTELFAPVLEQPVISAYDYPDLYRSLLASENVRPRIPVHPRLFIWGPFEARLQQTDVMVLGSLNDGTWPESTDPGPWLNRSMRRSLGLPLPEEKIGHAAHDFTAFLGAEQVVLTRALKADGVPTVPSRWLMRLTALLDGLGVRNDLNMGGTWLDWARARDRVAPQARLKPPKPRPAQEQRPRRLSVSRIETWISNPYAIFAKDILRLEPLPPLGQEPDAALRGSVIHAALAKFAHTFRDHLPADIKGELLAIAMAQFAELKAHPRVAAFWLPRFERFAAWFAETEPGRRAGIAQVVAETSGKLIMEAPGGPFTLTARADRIDIGAAGLTVTDYKTGQPPSASRVAAGFAPQLPLEAAMAAGGAFPEVPQAAVVGLRYTNVAGGEPPGRDVMVATSGIDGLAKSAVAGLCKLIATFDNPATPYEPKRRAIFKYDYDDYAHLARVAEWSADPGAGGEEA